MYVLRVCGRCAFLCFWCCGVLLCILGCVSGCVCGVWCVWCVCVACVARLGTRKKKCASSKRLRVSVKNASVYRQNARMLNTCARFAGYTRRRLEPTHGDVLNLHTGRREGVRWCGVVLFYVVWCGLACGKIPPCVDSKRLRVCVQDAHTETFSACQAAPHHIKQHNTTSHHTPPTEHKHHTNTTYTPQHTSHSHNHVNTHIHIHTHCTHTHIHTNAWICAQSTTDLDLETKR